MKLLFILISLSFGTIAFAQNYKRFQPDISPMNPLFRYDLKQSLKIPFNNPLPDVQRLVVPLIKHGGIVSLPQDHMPCIVPPQVTGGLIRNFWQPYMSNQTTLIPNPGEPLNLDELLKKQRE